MARDHKVVVYLVDEQREALEHFLRTSQHSNAIVKRMKFFSLPIATAHTRRPMTTLLTNSMSAS